MDVNRRCNAAILRQEFDRIKHRVWEYFDMDNAAKFEAMDSFRRYPYQALKCYPAIASTL